MSVLTCPNPIWVVSLDIRKVRIGVVLESDSPEAVELAAAFGATRYFEVTPARDRREVAPQVIAGKLRGFAVIPQDFVRHLGALFRF